MPTKIIRILLTAAASVACAGPALAQDSGGFYLKGFGGISALQGDDFELDGTTRSLSYDSGATYGGGFGYDYAQSPFRAELEFAYRSGDVTDLPAGVGSGGDFASTTLMLNGLYMFSTSTKLQPYVGLGLGYVTEIDFDIEAEGGAVEYSDRGQFAFQALIGIEYPVSDRFSVYGEARYFNAGSAELPGPGETELVADYDTFDFSAGLVFKF